MDRRKKIINSEEEKKKRLVITLEQKLDVIKRHSSGDFYAKIGRDTGMNESTIRHILQHADKIKEKVKALANSGCLQTSARNRSLAMIKMERRLSEWIEDCEQNSIQLNRSDIQTKAMSFFTEIKEDETVKEVSETFTASAGWFSRFKNRCQQVNAQKTEKAASPDSEAACSDTEAAYPRYTTFKKNTIGEDTFETKERFSNDSRNEDSKDNFSLFALKCPEDGSPTSKDSEDSNKELTIKMEVEVDEDDPISSELIISSTKRKLESEICSTMPAVSIERLLEIATNAKQTTEFDVFGNSVAAQLNGMPLLHAIQLQLEIQQLISKRRMKLIVKDDI